MTSTSKPGSASINKRKSQKLYGKFYMNLDVNTFDHTISYKLPDTSNIYFDRTQLRLIAVALYELDKSGKYTDSKFNRIKLGFR